MGIKTKIVGVTFENDDGTSRQELLSDVKRRGDYYVILEHDENNPKSDNAIAVYDVEGNQLGHIRDAIATEIIVWVEERGPREAQILNITGGENGANYGCNIEIPVVIERGDEPGVMEIREEAMKIRVEAREKRKETKSIFPSSVGFLVIIVAFFFYYFIYR